MSLFPPFSPPFSPPYTAKISLEPPLPPPDIHVLFLLLTAARRHQRASRRRRRSPATRVGLQPVLGANLDPRANQKAGSVIGRPRLDRFVGIFPIPDHRAAGASLPELRVAAEVTRLVIGARHPADGFSGCRRGHVLRMGRGGVSGYTTHTYTHETDTDGTDKHETDRGFGVLVCVEVTWRPNCPSEVSLKLKQKLKEVHVT